MESMRLPITFGSSTPVYSSNHSVHRFVLKDSSVFADFRLERNIPLISKGTFIERKTSVVFKVENSFTYTLTYTYWQTFLEPKFSSSASLFTLSLLGAIVVKWTETREIDKEEY